MKELQKYHESQILNYVSQLVDAETQAGTHFVKVNEFALAENSLSAMKSILEDLRVHKKLMKNSDRIQEIERTYAIKLWIKSNEIKTRNAVKTDLECKYPKFNFDSTEFGILTGQYSARSKVCIQLNESIQLLAQAKKDLDLLPQSYGGLEQYLLCEINEKEYSVDFIKKFSKECNEFTLEYNDHLRVELELYDRVANLVIEMTQQDDISIINAVCSQDHVDTIQKRILPTKESALAYTDFHNNYLRKAVNFMRLPLFRGDEEESQNALEKMIVDANENHILNTISDTVNEYQRKEIERIYSSAA